MPDSIQHRGVRIQLHRQRWRWRVQQDGTHVIRSFDSSSEAIDALDTVLDRRLGLQVRRSRATKPALTVRALCEEWIAERAPELAPATVSQYRIHIRKHIGEGIGSLIAGDVRPKDLVAFYRSLRWKPAKESHHILKSAYEWAIIRMTSSLAPIHVFQRGHRDDPRRTTMASTTRTNGCPQ